MKTEILFPEGLPHRGMQNLTKGNRQPVHQAVFTPPPADPFNAIDHAAEGRFDRVGCKRHPFLAVEPVVEKHDGLAGEVLDIRPGLGVAVGGKPCQKISEGTPDRFDQLPDQRLIRRRERLQVRLFQIEKRILLDQLQERLLFFPFDLVQIEEEAKIPLSMPEATLLVHLGRKKIFLDPRASVGEQHPQAAVIQAPAQVVVDRRPVPVDPEADQIERPTHLFRGQRPAELREHPRS